jgi:hypothetical protein
VNGAARHPISSFPLGTAPSLIPVTTRAMSAKLSAVLPRATPRALQPRPDRWNQFRRRISPCANRPAMNVTGSATARKVLRKHQHWAELA